MISLLMWAAVLLCNGTGLPFSAAIHRSKAGTVNHISVSDLSEPGHRQT